MICGILIVVAIALGLAVSFILGYGTGTKAGFDDAVEIYQYELKWREKSDREKAFEEQAMKDGNAE